MTATVMVLNDSLACPYKNTARGAFQTLLNPSEPPEKIVCEATDCNGIVVQKPILTIKKSVNQESAAVGEVLTFTLFVKNNGNIPLTNINIIDSLDTMLRFQEGSLQVNGIAKPDAAIGAGISIPILHILETASIVLKVVILSQGSGVLENQAIGTFDYMGCVENTLTSGTAVSNLIRIGIKNPCLQVEKTVDKSLAILGDTITYTINILNCGDTEAQNVVFQDILSSAVIFLADSFEIDGRSMNEANLQCGVYLGNIPIRGKITMQYMVQVVSMECGGFITNKAVVSYGYSTGHCSSVKRRSTQTAATKTCLAISLFKQLNIKNNLSIQACKPGIEEINSVTGKADTLNSYIIETPLGTSREGQKLTGHKLVFHGILKLEVEYTADDKEQTVYSESFSLPFSSYVVLPPEFKSDSTAKVKTVVENIYFKQTSNLCFFTNSTVLVIVNAK